jgi:hypothetical protein
LNAEYGDSAGGGIRGGKQGPLFEQGNAWLEKNFPRLDFIRRATMKESDGHLRVSSCHEPWGKSGAKDAAVQTLARLPAAHQSRSVWTAASLAPLSGRDLLPMDLFSLATSDDLAPTFGEVLESQFTAVTLRST